MRTHTDTNTLALCHTRRTTNHHFTILSIFLGWENVFERSTIWPGPTDSILKQAAWVDF